MKRLFCLTISAVFALMSFSACNEQQEAKQEITLAITDNGLSIPGKGGAAYAVFESNASVTTAVDRDWCTCSVKDDTVFFAATPNESLESRYATATLKAGGKSVDLTIEQFGFLSVEFYPEDIVAPAASSEYEYEYSYEDPIIATADQPWIHVETTETSLKISLDENMTMGTPYERVRSGKVSWRLGIDTGEINVNQKNVSFMKLDNNWTVKYEGTVHDETFDEDTDVISNTVGTVGLSGKYAIYYVSKSEVEASGQTIDDYILDVVTPEIRSSFDMIIMLYQILMGQTITYSDLLYEDSASEKFNPLEKGKYYALAIGYDDSCVETGHYQCVEFEVKGQVKPTTGYESWLGEWQVPRGSSVDVWTVTKKESGKTFNVTGIERDPQSVGPVEAVYDSEKDALVLYAFADAKEVSTSYGKASVGLYGKYFSEKEQKEFITTWKDEPYPIFTATHDGGNTATLNPTTLSFSDGSKATLSKFGFFGKLLEGENAGAYLSWTQDMTPLPNTITGEGGGDDPEGYDQWLGNWKIERLDYDEETFEPNGKTVIDTWTITQKASGSTYTISNFENIDDSYGTVTANFVSATGAMEIRSQILSTWTATGGVEVTEALYGIYVDPSDGEEYFTSEVDKILATCTMNGSGADVKAGEYSGTVFTQMQHLQMVEGDAYVHNLFGYMLPNTLAPSSSSSSVRKAGITSRIVMTRMTDASKAEETYVLTESKEVKIAIPYRPTKFMKSIK